MVFWANLIVLGGFWQFWGDGVRLLGKNTVEEETLFVLCIRGLYTDIILLYQPELAFQASEIKNLQFLEGNIQNCGQIIIKQLRVLQFSMQQSKIIINFQTGYVNLNSIRADQFSLLNGDQGQIRLILKQLYKNNKTKMSDKHSAPAFSIGGPHQKIKHSNETAPGPGAYESATFMQTIKYSTSRHEGQRSRFKGYDTLAPGPGTYSHQASKSQGPTALVMSRSRTIEPSSKLAPGPGSYNPDYKKMVKGEGGYTIGGSSRIGDIVGQAVKKPGPGDYETNRSSVTKDSGFKIGNQKRTDMVLNHFTPGPGQYQQKQLQEICSRRDGNTVFSKSGRSFSTANLIPGPGTYVVPDCFKDSRTKGFSIISKSNQVPAYSTKVPGPGAYNSLETDLIRQKGASFSMGKNPKMKMENQRQLLGGPGPQRYTIAQGAFESKSSLFGKASRPSPANQKGAPGPGSYTFRYQSTLPQFSIPKSSSTWLKNSSNPGPGTYESKIGQTNFNSFKIAKDEKRSTYDEKKGIPGPGSYQFSSPMQKSIGAKIGNEKRGGEKVSSNPGPGNYQISSTISNLPKYVH